MPTSGDTVLNMGDTVVMDLPDGRELAWLESGDPNGPAVFVFHGTPGSRLEVSCDQVPIISSGVRFIAVDRAKNSQPDRVRTLRCAKGETRQGVGLSIDIERAEESRLDFRLAQQRLKKAPQRPHKGKAKGQRLNAKV